MNIDKRDIIIIVIILVILIGGVYLIFGLGQNNQDNNSKEEQSTVPQPQPPQSQGNSSSFTIQGMKVDIVQQGSGPEAKNSDRVTVHYTGTFQNGTVFDSSLRSGKPFQFTLGEGGVIKGWELGVAGMKVGEKRKLVIPPELGYGEMGYPGAIPPNTTLFFDIELLKIN